MVDFSFVYFCSRLELSINILMKKIYLADMEKEVFEFHGSSDLKTFWAFRIIRIQAQLMKWILFFS